jgi:hypothetical protein
VGGVTELPRDSQACSPPATGAGRCMEKTGARGVIALVAGGGGAWPAMRSSSLKCMPTGKRCARQRIIQFRLGFTFLCSMQHLGRPAARSLFHSSSAGPHTSRELCQHCSDAPNVFILSMGCRREGYENCINNIRNQKLKSVLTPFPKSGLSHTVTLYWALLWKRIDAPPCLYR